MNDQFITSSWKPVDDFKHTGFRDKGGFVKKADLPKNVDSWMKMVLRIKMDFRIKAVSRIKVDIKVELLLKRIIFLRAWCGILLGVEFAHKREFADKILSFQQLGSMNMLIFIFCVDLLTKTLICKIGSTFLWSNALLDFTF